MVMIIEDIKNQPDQGKITVTIDKNGSHAEIPEPEIKFEEKCFTQKKHNPK